VHGVRIGVVVASWNSDVGWLGEALASAWSQEPAPHRVLVVDAASPQPLSSPAWPATEWLRLDANAGTALARNLGARHLGDDVDLLCFLDHDDRLLPGAFATGLPCESVRPVAPAWSGSCGDHGSCRPPSCW